VLYRLSPPNRLTWADVPSRGVIELVEENGGDLGGLEWREVEAREFSIDLLRLAFRHGSSACRDGIVVSALHVVDLGRSDELRLLSHEGTELHAELRGQQAFMEKVLPGWTAHGEELDRRITEGMEEAAREAEEDLAQELTAPPKPEVVAHWTALGGAVPDPL
jgi:hypothetical protein